MPIQENRYRTLAGREGDYIYDYEKYTLVEMEDKPVNSKDFPDFHNFLFNLNKMDRIQKAEAAMKKAEQEKIWAANKAAQEAS